MREHQRADFKDIILATATHTKFDPIAVEKDYYMTLLAQNIPSLSREMVLTGSMALNKVYFDNYRLCDDIDLTYFTKDDLKILSARSKVFAHVRQHLKPFLQELGLKCHDPDGRICENARLYIFYVQYSSLMTGRDEGIRVEITLENIPTQEPLYMPIKYFYQDNFAGLETSKRVLSLSLDEIVVAKLYMAAQFRKPAAKRARHLYDLGHIAQSGFDFYQDKFIERFKYELFNHGLYSDYRRNFGLSEKEAQVLNQQARGYLSLYIRRDETFDLPQVFRWFNAILSDPMFYWPRGHEASLLFRKITLVAQHYLNI